MGFSLFRNKMGIELQLDDFLNQVSEAGLILTQGVAAYLGDDIEGFMLKLDEVTRYERKGDQLRRFLEEQLYTKTLIPESRGDVLELLESVDSLLGRFKGSLWTFEIERPCIPVQLHDDFSELVDCSVASVENIVLSSRAFFHSSENITDHIHKVSFWENEADKVSTKLQRKIFRLEDFSLCEKMQLRDFVRHIDKIADRAEDVADRLSIAVIKRSL